MKLTVRIIRAVSKHYKDKGNKIFYNVGTILIELGFKMSSHQTYETFVKSNREAVLSLYKAIPIDTIRKITNDPEIFKSYKSGSNKFLQSPEWKQLRTKVLSTFGRRCMKCSSTKVINVDHIKPRYHYPELSLDINNLQVLCNRCNELKGNKYYTDYRTQEQRELINDIR